MAEIIKTDGTRTATTPANGEYFTLEEMQDVAPQKVKGMSNK
mgnify:CR=1 FL=1